MLVALHHRDGLVVAVPGPWHPAGKDMKRMSSLGGSPEKLWYRLAGERSVDHDRLLQRLSRLAGVPDEVTAVIVGGDESRAVTDPTYRL